MKCFTVVLLHLLVGVVARGDDDLSGDKEATELFRKVLDHYGTEANRSKAGRVKIQYDVDLFKNEQVDSTTKATIFVDGNRQFSDLYVSSKSEKFTRFVDSSTDVWMIEADGSLAQFPPDIIQMNLIRGKLKRFSSPYRMGKREGAIFSLKPSERIDGVDCPGICVTSKEFEGHAITYVDPETFLVQRYVEVLRSKTTTTNSFNYVRFNGLPISMKEIVSQNGEKGYERRLTSFDILDKIDEKYFEKPKIVVTPRRP